MKINPRVVARSLAVLLLLTGASVWFFGGAHPGWTKTSVAVEFVDEITGIEGRRYEKRFVPGVEFPAAGALLAAGLIGLSFFLPGKKRAA